MLGTVLTMSPVKGAEAYSAYGYYEDDDRVELSTGPESAGGSEIEPGESDSARSQKPAKSAKLSRRTGLRRSRPSTRIGEGASDEGERASDERASDERASDERASEEPASTNGSSTNGPSSNGPSSNGSSAHDSSADGPTEQPDAGSADASARGASTGWIS